MIYQHHNKRKRSRCHEYVESLTNAFPDCYYDRTNIGCLVRLSSFSNGNWKTFVGFLEFGEYLEEFG